MTFYCDDSFALRDIERFCSRRHWSIMDYHKGL